MQRNFKTIFYRSLKEAGCNNFTSSLLADVINRFLVQGLYPVDPMEIQHLRLARQAIGDSRYAPGRM
ncbi:MAG: hypothetical protein F6K19_44655, partial [Cyanothece sp. SIO1E1]|nr:hypothetical protein [Cyanothece sp. SIO1E1]